MRIYDYETVLTFVAHIAHFYVNIIKQSHMKQVTEENEANLFVGSAFARVDIYKIHMLFWTHDVPFNID